LDEVRVEPGIRDTGTLWYCFSLAITSALGFTICAVPLPVPAAALTDGALVGATTLGCLVTGRFAVVAVFFGGAFFAGAFLAAGFLAAAALLRRSNRSRARPVISPRP
jgi:hypothetical protein